MCELKYYILLRYHDVLVGSEPGTKLDWTDVSSELKLANWTPPTNILAEPNGKADPFATSKHAACSLHRVPIAHTEQDWAGPSGSSLYSLSLSLPRSRSLSTRPSPSCPLSVHDFRRLFSLSVLEAVSIESVVSLFYIYLFFLFATYISIR